MLTLTLAFSGITSAMASAEVASSPTVPIPVTKCDVTVACIRDGGQGPVKAPNDTQAKSDVMPPNPTPPQSIVGIITGELGSLGLYVRALFGA